MRISRPIVGLLLTVLGWLLMMTTVVIWWLSIFLQAEGGEGSAVNVFPGVIPLLIMLALGMSGTWCWRRGKQLRMQSAEYLLARDRRPPVLYFRSFAADGRESAESQTARWWIEMFGVVPPILTEEEELVRVLRDIGPVVAIGNPDERLPALGAPRLYFSHDDWQARVLELLPKSRLVVLRAGATQGLLWELQRVQELCKPSQVLLYVPKDKLSRKPVDVQPEYESIRTNLGPHLRHPLPESIGSSRFLWFDNEWVPNWSGSDMKVALGLSGSRLESLREELSAFNERFGWQVRPPRSALGRWVRTVLFSLVLFAALMVFVFFWVSLKTN